jgi:predicted PurR-regulated permease PerM
MLIYGNTPKDIMKMMWRRRIKLLAIIVVIAVAVMLTGTAKADPQTVINNITSVPGKLHNHIQMEIAKTKEFQKESWAKSKIQFANLKKLFIKE